VSSGLARRVFAEFLGTGLLVTVVVGSGIMAARLSPRDVGLQLLENSLATAAGLTVLILLLGPVSGAHFNPVVTLADWALGRRHGSGLSGGEVAVYLPAQVAGAICGAVLANPMFGLSAVTASTHHRSTPHLLLGEVVATAGLVALIFALARQGRGHLAPASVGAYIGAAYWFTSSTSFANPAVTIGRAFTDTFAGIAPSSVPGFIAAQLVGAAIGAGVVLVLYPLGAPQTGAAGNGLDDVVVAHPHPDAHQAAPAGAAG
jgi:glycerol uptake facilitator-like aquaporin